MLVYSEIVVDDPSILNHFNLRIEKLDLKKFKRNDYRSI